MPLPAFLVASKRSKVLARSRSHVLLNKFAALLAAICARIGSGTAKGGAVFSRLFLLVRLSFWGWRDRHAQALAPVRFQEADILGLPCPVSAAHLAARRQMSLSVEAEIRFSSVGICKGLQSDTVPAGGHSRFFPYGCRQQGQQASFLPIRFYLQQVIIFAPLGYSTWTWLARGGGRVQPGGMG